MRIKRKKWLKGDEHNLTKIKQILKKVNCWSAIKKGRKFLLKQFTHKIDSKYYLSILYERLKDMNELGEVIGSSIWKLSLA